MIMDNHSRNHNHPEPPHAPANPSIKSSPRKSQIEVPGRGPVVLTTQIVSNVGVLRLP
jgi:hypothetical protein